MKSKLESKRMTPAEVAAAVPGVKLGAELFTPKYPLGDTPELRQQYESGELKPSEGFEEW